MPVLTNVIEFFVWLYTYPIVLWHGKESCQLVPTWLSPREIRDIQAMGGNPIVANEYCSRQEGQPALAVIVGALILAGTALVIFLIIKGVKAVREQHYWLQNRMVCHHIGCNNYTLYTSSSSYRLQLATRSEFEMDAHGHAPRGFTSLSYSLCSRDLPCCDSCTEFHEKTISGGPSVHIAHNDPELSPWSAFAIGVTAIFFAVLLVIFVSVATAPTT